MNWTRHRRVCPPPPAFDTSFRSPPRRQSRTGRPCVAASGRTHSTANTRRRSILLFVVHFGSTTCTARSLVGLPEAPRNECRRPLSPQQGRDCSNANPATLGVHVSRVEEDPPPLHGQYAPLSPALPRLLYACAPPRCLPQDSSLPRPLTCKALVPVRKALPCHEVQGRAILHLPMSPASVSAIDKLDALAAHTPLRGRRYTIGLASHETHAAYSQPRGDRSKPPRVIPREALSAHGRIYIRLARLHVYRRLHSPGVFLGLQHFEAHPRDRSPRPVLSRAV
ncbi:hypothetical protein C8J57DRAFT_1262330 [Mycena rebaudengoi]|nr:hypothetical protein C8J57DRAFT_1262330 [Mycena rebaudengoi]